ncbi:unnamed protein product [Meloidogyne enterolobii]|uniref:Uncharacterized protein n=1 Tax=Meloidogyne enterolobii TaxID=390850 RepID=A0ACB0Z0X9_MELEN
MIHSFFIFIPVIFKGKKWPLSIPHQFSSLKLLPSHITRPAVLPSGRFPNRSKMYQGEGG